MLLCWQADEQLSLDTHRLHGISKNSITSAGSIHLEIGHSPVAEVDRIGRICLDCL